jgi:hypothetical protein
MPIGKVYVELNHASNGVKTEFYFLKSIEFYLIKCQFFFLAFGMQ